MKAELVKLRALEEQVNERMTQYLAEAERAKAGPIYDFLDVSSTTERPTEADIETVCSALDLDEDEIALVRDYLDDYDNNVTSVVSTPVATTRAEIARKVEEEILYEMLMEAFYKARKNKRSTYDEASFEVCLFRNLASLTRSILDQTYAPSRSMAFVVFRPVTREIFAAPFRDRVVHHFIFDWCYPWWARHFCYDSYSCQEGKGTSLAVERCDHMMRACSNNYHTETWVFKFDIKAFFMSMPRALLFDQAIWGLKQEFSGGWLYSLLRFLWFQVVTDDPAVRAVKRGERANWGSPTGFNSHRKKCLPYDKSLFHQPPGIGIVIGNLTSQLLSNIFLDQLDRFIRYDLGFKYYGRYVDDFYIFITDPDKYKVIQAETFIATFLSFLGPRLHFKKKYCQPIARGVEFIGARIYPYHILPSHRLVRNFKNACLKYATGFSNTASIASYLGYLSHYRTHHLIQHTFDYYGFDYQPFF